VSTFVVDASLVVKWFVPEVHSEAATRWLEQPHDYVAPDLLFPEVANAVWKKARRGELDAADAHALVRDVSQIAVETVAMRGLVEDAHALAAGADITVYDATYLALAIRMDAQLVTGDDRFARKLAGHPLLAPHIRSVIDVAEP
jgi:predicted nucleic acid-binding protein